MEYPVPAYLTPFVMTSMVIVITSTLLGLQRALRRSTWPDTDRAKALWTISTLLVGWFVIAALTSIAGVYRPQSGPPTIQYGLLIPIIVGVLLFRSVPLLRRTLAVVPNSWLVGLQLYRVLGVIFLVLYAGAHLPAAFALPAGIGDVLVGIFAPFAAASFARSPEASTRRVRLWNWIGIADLVIALSMGFATSPSPFQLLSFDHPNQLVGMFPLALIPVFAVPLSILLHIASLQKLRQRQSIGDRQLPNEQFSAPGAGKRNQAFSTQS
jgi:hypothetical protein